MRLAPTLRLLLPDLMQPSQWWTDGTARNASARKAKERTRIGRPRRRGSKGGGPPLTKNPPTTPRRCGGSADRSAGSTTGRRRPRRRSPPSWQGARPGARPRRWTVAALRRSAARVPLPRRDARSYRRRCGTPAELDDATAADMQEVENDAISGPLACASQRLKQILMQAASGPSDEQPCQARALVQTVGAEFRPDVVRATFEALVKRGWLVSASVDEAALSLAFHLRTWTLCERSRPRARPYAQLGPASNGRPAPADASAPAGAEP